MNWKALRRSVWYYLAAFSVGLSVLTTAALIRKVLEVRGDDDDDHGDAPNLPIDPPTHGATFNHFPIKAWHELNDRATAHVKPKWEKVSAEVRETRAE